MELSLPGAKVRVNESSIIRLHWHHEGRPAQPRRLATKLPLPADSKPVWQSF